ncbi:MAG: asparagine synthetase B family protein [Thiobacillaceae bacterium]
MPPDSVTAQGFFVRLAGASLVSGLSEPPISLAPCASAAGTSLLAHHEQGWLAFCGSLYNRLDLATRLGLPTDTAPDRLLSSALTRWPDDWQRRLDGTWVAAHGELQRRRITLYRDPSGRLGLFYTRSRDGGLAFASDLHTLLQRAGMWPPFAPPALHEYLRLLDIAPPQTLYAGVQAVPPGECVVLRLDGFDPEQAIQAAAYELRPISPQEVVNELERLLCEAIRRRLDGVGRPAAFLSGGVDSALICALAARERPDLTAITVGFDGADYDETPIAAAIARHLGIRHEVLRFSRAELLQALTTAGRAMEQPMADPALPVSLLAFAWARRRFDAVLDGSGADELVGAMPPRHKRLAVQWAARIPTALRRRIARGLARLPVLAGYQPVFDFEHPAEPLMRWHGFRREEIEALTGTPVDLSHTRLYQVFERFAPTEHYARYTALLEAMPGDRLTQACRITGLDVRFPYWSPEVEALLRGLPQALRWRPDSPKFILRTLLARHVPRALWDVPKHGFDFPLHAFLTAEDFGLVRRYLLEADWRRWQILDAQAVAGYGRRFMSGEPGLTFRVWALVVLAAWLEGHAR